MIQEYTKSYNNIQNDTKIYKVIQNLKSYFQFEQIFV